MSPKISVCCIKFEVMNDEADSSTPSGSSFRGNGKYGASKNTFVKLKDSQFFTADEAAAAEAAASDGSSLIRGRREPRRYRVETYSKEAGQDSKRLFPKELSSYVRQGSSEKEACENDLGATSEEGDVVSFSSGNPFVEVTRGILHLYKEK